MTEKNILIAGIGNPYRGDDAFGSCTFPRCNCAMPRCSDTTVIGGSSLRPVVAST